MSVAKQQVPGSQRRQRGESRREELMDRAAALIAAKGFDGTSMREIAATVGMLPGSLYYHFESKEELLQQLHQRVVSSMTDRVQAALTDVSEPWDRLQAAAAAHLDGLLETGNLVAIISPDFPEQRKALNQALKAQRDAYEQIFRDLFDALDLVEEADPRLLRLQMFGALNWTSVWYRPERGQSPAEIARTCVDTLRRAYGRGR